MKRIRWQFEFPDDVQYLVSVLGAAGIEATPLDAAAAWRHASTARLQGWLIPPSNPVQVLKIFREGFNIQNNEEFWPVGWVKTDEYASFPFSEPYEPDDPTALLEELSGESSDEDDDDGPDAGGSIRA